MHAGFPKPGAANLVVAVIFMSFCGLTRRKHKMNGRSGGFDALTGVPALRPSEDDIKKAKTKCLSKPITTEKLSIKVRRVIVFFSQRRITRVANLLALAPRTRVLHTNDDSRSVSLP